MTKRNKFSISHDLSPREGSRTANERLNINLPNCSNCSIPHHVHWENSKYSSSSKMNSVESIDSVTYLLQETSMLPLHREDTGNREDLQIASVIYQITWIRWIQLNKFPLWKNSWYNIYVQNWISYFSFFNTSSFCNSRFNFPTEKQVYFMQFAY